MWDDYLDQRQFALKAAAVRILHWFADWRSLASTTQLEESANGKPPAQLAVRLLDAGILVAEGSARHQREERVCTGWREWSPLARAFHYSTRHSSRTRFPGMAADRVRLTAKRDTQPPPPAFKRLPERPHLDLAESGDGGWHSRDLLDVLYRRRSNRRYGQAPIELADLATVLRVAAGPVPGGGAAGADAFQTVFKTSPSGGGRHPTELYACVRNVAGVEPGVYHYDALGHALERLRPPPADQELATACADQAWVAAAAAVVFYTSVPARSQWKYPDTRAYRALLLDVGHLNQTVSLIATALGLYTTFTAVLRDELVEELLGCDAAVEFVVGCATLGQPP